MRNSGPGSPLGRIQELGSPRDRPSLDELALTERRPAQPGETRVVVDHQLEGGVGDVDERYRCLEKGNARGGRDSEGEVVSSALEFACERSGQVPCERDALPVVEALALQHACRRRPNGLPGERQTARPRRSEAYDVCTGALECSHHVGRTRPLGAVTRVLAGEECDPRRTASGRPAKPEGARQG